MHCYLRRRDLSGWIWNLALQTQEWFTRLTMGRNNCNWLNHRQKKVPERLRIYAFYLLFYLGQRRFMSIKSINLLDSLKVFSTSCNYVHYFRTILVTHSFVTERVPRRRLKPWHSFSSGKMQYAQCAVKANYCDTEIRDKCHNTAENSYAIKLQKC